LIDLFVYVALSDLEQFVSSVTGETLQDERNNGGAFVASDGIQFPHKLIPVSHRIL
jgi:hypothetical protein